MVFWLQLKSVYATFVTVLVELEIVLKTTLFTVCAKFPSLLLLGEQAGTACAATTTEPSSVRVKVPKPQCF